jgi:Relaxase/Mobilisation nuclease domain
MVPKLRPAGKSFKSLVLYLLHDPNKAKTSERVGWTHTLNTAADSPSLAVDEMLWTLRAAEDLKREAGVRAGGRHLKNPVKHFALNWHPSENPTRDHMIAKVESFLAHMGWKDHQALIVSHTDKHPHVHVMLNTVHPETGKVLDAGLERRRAQEWAKAYERENGLIFCEERLKPKQEREKSPTREAWQRMKPSERAHDRDEIERLNKTPDYFARHDATDMNGREWEALKAYQKQQREQFFLGGKAAFRDARNAAFREIRAEFRGQWNVYYATARNGHDRASLAETKVALMAAQNRALDERRTVTCDALREQRDTAYESMLAQQRFDRAELDKRQAQGLRTYHLFDMVYPELAPGEPVQKKQQERQHRAGWQVVGVNADRDDASAAKANRFTRSAQTVIDPIDHHGPDCPVQPGIVQRSKEALSPTAATDGVSRGLKDPHTGLDRRQDEAPTVKPARVRNAEITDAVAAREPSEKAREMNEREEAKDRKEEQALVTSWSRSRRSRGRRD